MDLHVYVVGILYEQNGVLHAVIVHGEDERARTCASAISPPQR